MIKRIVDKLRHVFGKSPHRGDAGSGPVFKPIFRKVINGNQISDAQHISHEHLDG